MGGYMPKREIEPGGIIECLNRWQWIDGDIDEIKLELNDLDERFSQASIARYCEGFGESRKADIVGEMLAKKEELERQYKEELDFLLDCKFRIMQLLKTLSAFDKQIITLRYLKGYSWVRIANELERKSHSKLCLQTNAFLEDYDKGQYKPRKRYKARR